MCNSQQQYRIIKNLIKQNGIVESSDHQYYLNVIIIFDDPNRQMAPQKIECSWKNILNIKLTGHQNKT